MGILMGKNLVEEDKNSLERESAPLLLATIKLQARGEALRGAAERSLRAIAGQARM
jgi:hypothetical protein